MSMRKFLPVLRRDNKSDKGATFVLPVDSDGDQNMKNGIQATVTSSLTKKYAVDAEEEMNTAKTAPKVEGFDDSSDESDSDDYKDVEELHDFADDIIQDASSRGDAGSSSDDSSDYSVSSVHDALDDFGEGGDTLMLDVKDEKRSIVNKIHFLERLSESDRIKVSEKLQSEEFSDGQTIIREGEFGDRFYFIAEGEVVVSRKDKKTGEERDLTHMYAGDMFGELGLIYNKKRDATITSVGNSTCMYLTKTDADEFGDIATFLKIRNCVKKSKILSQLPPDSQKACIDKLEPTIFEADEYVFKQGDRGEHFYMITKGSVRILETAADGTEKKLLDVYEGDSFGELALVEDAPRTASIRANGRVNCMRLNAKNFEELLGESDFLEILKSKVQKTKKTRERRAWHRANSKGSLYNSGKKNSLVKQMSNRPTNEQTVLVRSVTQGYKTVNGYILKKLIGKGTFGKVYLCTHQDTGVSLQSKFARSSRTGSIAYCANVHQTAQRICGNRSCNHEEA